MPYRSDELDVAHIDDAQAAAIGRLTLSFNFLEASIAHAIEFMLSADMAEIGVLLVRMSFQQKTDRLDALVKYFTDSLKMPTKAAADAPQIERWAAERLFEWQALRDRVRKAGNYRNGLVHCTVEVQWNKPSPRLLSKSGAELSSDAESISREARNLGALGIEIVTFGHQFYGSIRNFKKRNAKTK